MPKDPTRNVDRYKVRGGQFDDLDRTKNEGLQTGEAAPLTGGAEESNFIPGETPQEEAERKRRLIEEVHAQAEQRRQREGAGAKKSAKKGAKKPAKRSAKKAAPKSSKAVRRAAKKGGKSAAGAKAARGRGPAGGAKKGAKKSGGAKSTKGRAGRPGAG